MANDKMSANQSKKTHLGEKATPLERYSDMLSSGDWQTAELMIPDLVAGGEDVDALCEQLRSSVLRTVRKKHGRMKKGADESKVCPICGARNNLIQTFKCKVCGKDYICDAHLDEKYNCCMICAAEKRKNDSRIASEAEQEELQKKGVLAELNGLIIQRRTVLDSLTNDVEQLRQSIYKYGCSIRSIELELDAVQRQRKKIEADLRAKEEERRKREEIEEAARRAEAARKAEEERRRAEAARAEEFRRAEAAREAEEARREEARRQAEQRRKEQEAHERELHRQQKERELKALRERHAAQERMERRFRRQRAFRAIKFWCVILLLLASCYFVTSWCISHFGLDSILVPKVTSITPPPRRVVCTDYEQECEKIARKLKTYTSGGYLYDQTALAQTVSAIKALREMREIGNKELIQQRYRAMKDAYNEFLNNCTWNMGMRHPKNQHVVATSQEGKWEPEPGYVFVHPGTADLTVRPVNANWTKPQQWYEHECEVIGGNVKFLTSGGYKYNLAVARQIEDIIRSIRSKIRIGDAEAVARLHQELANTYTRFEHSCFWQANMQHPKFPHVISGTEKNHWATEQGWEFVNPGTADFTVRRKKTQVVCRSCQGRRVQVRNISCPNCGGQGHVANPAAQVGNAFGSVLNSFGSLGHGGRKKKPFNFPRQPATITCPSCRGRRVIQQQVPCTACDGVGTISR